VAPTPIRARKTEEVLRGKPYTEEVVEKAAETITSDISPIDDVRSSADYRNHTAGVLLKDALKEAWQRAGGK
jgi:carbon-monoxide dehydrogenase medium subunit